MCAELLTAHELSASELDQQ